MTELSYRPRGTADAAGLTGLFSAELIPVIRRMGERDRDDLDPGPGADAGTRHAVWSGLADLGVIERAVPPAAGEFGGLRDCLEMAEVMGTALYQGLFFDTVTAAEVIAGADDGKQELTAVRAGDVSIAVATRDGGNSDPLVPGLMRFAPESGTVTATRRYVCYAGEADYLLVVGRLEDDPSVAPVALLVPAEQPGVRLRRQHDLGRGGLYAVDLDAASARPVGPPRDLRWSWPSVLARARLRHAAYLIGLTSGAIDLTLAWTRRRRVFGKPLAHHQVPAFRLAALASRAEAIRMLALRSAMAADQGSCPRQAACYALMLAADLALDAGAEAIQLHGSLGLLETSDAQLFYRRAVVDSILLGTGRQLRAEAARLRERAGGGAG